MVIKKYIIGYDSLSFADHLSSTFGFSDLMEDKIRLVLHMINNFNINQSFKVCID